MCNIVYRYNRERLYVLRFTGQYTDIQLKAIGVKLEYNIIINNIYIHTNNNNNNDSKPKTCMNIYILKLRYNKPTIVITLYNI